MEEIKIKKVILAGMGEIVLKGLNRYKFESRLMGNIRRRIEKYGKFHIEQKQSRIWIVPEKEMDLDDVAESIRDVFGLVSVSVAWRIEKDMYKSLDATVMYVDELLKNNKKLRTFKVEARRSDKRFKFDSPKICEETGARILDNFDSLSVDVHDPDFILRVEVRDDIFIYSGKREGPRGLPVGTAGKGMLLLSGGIDSPVAGYMMASRGMEIEAVYFHSYPYTSDDSKEKVIDLARILSRYTGWIKLHIVNFTELQLELRDKCPQDMLVVITRRFMMRIAAKLAEGTSALALITGESLGQVASQTAQAIGCTDACSTLPVFRPLVGMDKEDTIKIARRIGTFETSILPYEDCCTLFVAKHPKTKPSLEQCEESEKDLEIEKLVENAVSATDVMLIDPRES